MSEQNKSGFSEIVTVRAYSGLLDVSLTKVIDTGDAAAAGPDHTARARDRAASIENITTKAIMSGSRWPLPAYKSYTASKLLATECVEVFVDLSLSLSLGVSYRLEPLLESLAPFLRRIQGDIAMAD